jgi:competence protein ComEA
MKKLLIALFVVLFTLPTFTFASNMETTGTETVASALINVNLATVKQLAGLPGIGKVTAERIVVFREANGPFATIDDLLKINGLGKKTLAKIRDQISVH